jgi:DeoR/GlpR family transcriptional regulator of sugar metabolism
VSKADDRRQEIADHLKRQGQVRIEDLARLFGVSRMTIHRHVDELVEQGVAQKLHGLVALRPSSVYESSFRYRQSIGRREKDALAKAAMAYVEAGQVVMLDDSSTAGAVAPLLPALRPLTVITNSVHAGLVMTQAGDADFICLGGHFNPTYNAYIGLVCEKAIAGLRADLLICSASAVSGGLAYIQDQHVVRVKQAMMRACVRRILLLEAAKFDRVALHAFEDLTAFDAVLVSGCLDAAVAERLRLAGVRLHLIGAAP